MLLTEFWSRFTNRIFFVFEVHLNPGSMYEQQSDMTTLQCNLQKPLKLLHDCC